MRVFAAHFSAMAGALAVPELGNPKEMKNLPSGALSLACAAVRHNFPASNVLTSFGRQVERAFTLWANELLDTDAVNTSRPSNAPTVLKARHRNLSSGKLTSLTDFNERNWGDITRSFVDNARNLRPQKFDQVIKLACDFAKTSKGHDVDVGKVRSRVVVISDDEDACKFYFNYVSQSNIILVMFRTGSITASLSALVLIGLYTQTSSNPHSMPFCPFLRPISSSNISIPCQRP